MEGDDGGVEAQPEYAAREYQLELFNYAVKRNTIICLKTGAGKTYISVLLIKELQHQIRKSYLEDGKRTFFLVPKVALVTQQAEVIRAHTVLEVGTFWGACGVDDWTKEVWQRVLVKNEVLVMTAQILLNMLQYGFITMERINLIVMDECHRAVKNDAYRTIMKSYVQLEERLSLRPNELSPSLPRILGLTASVLHGKCNPAKIAENIQALETTLRSRIITANDLESVNRFATKPTEICLGYSNANLDYEDLSTMVQEIIMECSKQMTNVVKVLDLGDKETMGPVVNREKDGRLISEIEDKERILNDLKINSNNDSDDASYIGINIKCSPGFLLNNVKAVFDALGPWATKEIVIVFLKDFRRFKKDARCLGQELKLELFSMLESSLTTLLEVLDNYFIQFDHKKVILKCISPKLKRLLDLLRTFPKVGDDSFRGIILVEQRAIAWMLNHYLLRLGEMYPETYGDFHPCYIVGHGISLAYTHRTGMDVDDQSTNLDFFKKGICNLLIGTSVVEEGVDIPECNVVVRFDLPKTFCSYVQSKGRARAQKALYILMHPDESADEVGKDLTYYKALEEELVKISQRNKRKSNTDELQSDIRDELDKMYHFQTKAMATITLTSAIGILDRYCSSLPHDRFTSVKPKFSYIKSDSDFTQVCCVVTLPSATSLTERTLNGAMWSDKMTAKKIAAFEACKRLFENGDVNENLLPSQNYVERFQHILGIAPWNQNKQGLVKAGTKKRKRTFLKQIAEDFTDCFPVPKEPTYLYAIRLIREKHDLDGKKYCGPYFGILTSKPITKVLPFTLYGKYSATVVFQHIRNFCDDSINIDHLKAFHYFVFDEVCRISNSLFTFAPEDCGSFLIVPLTCDKIDWDLIDRYLQFKNDINDEVQLTAKVSDIVLPKYGDLESRSRRFYVSKVCCPLSPLTALDEKSNCSILDHFQRKYGATVTKLDQPLLKVDYAPNTLNLIHPGITQMAKKQEDKGRIMYQIPELCKIFPLDNNQYREAYCLPSVLFRLNGLLLATELKTSLINEAGVMPSNLESPYIIVANTLEKLSGECVVDDEVIFASNLTGKNRLRPDSLLACLFQAITTNSASNWDCLERLEVIGDSFLKIAITVCLYCNFNYLQEGGLTTLRTGLVRNYNLVEHAKQIPYILNGTVFQPKFTWLPPGFTIQEDVMRALIEQSVPSHLWIHAKPEDVDDGTSSDMMAWLVELERRWSATDHFRRSNPEKKTVYAPSPVSDESDGNESGEEAFDRYKKQLIGDKSIADSVEAIIGAVLLTCGRSAALRTIDWFGLKILKAQHKCNGNLMDIDDDSDSLMEVDDDRPFPWTVPMSVVTRWNSRMSESYGDLEIFEKEIGYSFKNKGLLIQAVIHPTHDNELVENYQKLEFLGDAVLDYLVTMHLYQKMPTLSPGSMTDLRSALVDNCTFAYLAVENGMHKVMRYKSGLLFTVIDSYLQHKKDLAHPKDSMYMTKENDASNMEEIEVPKALGDIFESVAGAIFVDSGLSLKTVWDVYYPMLKDVIEKYSTALPINPVRCLYEKFPNALFSKPLKTSAGYSVDVSINGKVFRGNSQKKNVAKMAAAKCALRSLNILSVRNLK